MGKELTELQNKIEKLDEFMEKSFDPQNPETLYDNSEYSALSNEVYSGLMKCESFNTPEELELRNRALVQVELAGIVNDVKTTKIDEKTATAEQRKARDDAMLKYDCAVSGVKKGQADISKSIDLDLITWVASTDADELQKSLGSAAIDKVMSVDPSSPYYQIKESNFGKGGLATFTYLMPKEDGKGYQLDTKKTAEHTLTEYLKDPKVSDMMRSYKMSEKAWLTSAMTPTQEIENRLRFVNTYEKELKGLYTLLNADPKIAPGIRDVANGVLEKNGIGELVKDYKTFKDPENKNTEFLMENANKYEKSFRKEYANVQNDKKDTLTQNQDLKDFHKFLLSYGDYGTGVTSNVNNTTKQARPFIENFIGLPEKDQMKALYMLENKMYKTNAKVTDEQMKDYKPDLKKCEKALKASNLKFWKRANTSYMYWDKLKTCVDKVYDQAKPVKEKKKSALALKLGKLATKVGSIFTRIKAKNIKGASALSAASAVLGSVEGIKTMVAEKDVTTGAQKADQAIGMTTKIIDSAKMNAMTNMISTFNPKYMQAFQGLAIASNALNTGKSIANIVTSKQCVNKTIKLGEDIQTLKNTQKLTDDEAKIAKKLETNTRMLKVINKDKVKIATCETVKNSVALGSSVAMATGVGVAALIPQAIVSVGTKVAENQIRKNNTNNVIDAKLYESSEDKAQKVKETKAQILGRYARMPENLRKKYTDQVADVYYDDKKVSAQMRQEAVRESGQVNLNATKNSYLVQAGNDAYEILKSGAEKVQNGKELTDLDKKFVGLANDFIKSTGGKEIDIKSMKIEGPEAQKQQEVTVNRVAKNMKV